MRRCSIIQLVLCAGCLCGSVYGYSGGSGTPTDPYRIASVDDLIALGGTPDDYTKHFILTADIDLSGYTFDQAVIAPQTDGDGSSFHGTQFCGTLDGDGHVIAHLRIQGQSFLALIGELGKGGVVRRLRLVDVDISSQADYIGAVAGQNAFGSIVSNYSTGTVTGDREVGGLVGWNWGGTVVGSHSACTVDGREHTGGVVGRNSSHLINCYSTGTVSGHRYTGGLAGENTFTIWNCYSTAKVIGLEDAGGLVGWDNTNRLTSNFWDIEASGRTDSAGGVGLTTAQMQTIDTYLDAGWDFQAESAHGTSQWWTMPQEGGYPVLSALDGYQPPVLSGDGTEASPYQISNAQELGAVCHYPPHACFELAGDVDLSGIVWPHAVIPSFNGVFNGNGHAIGHLTVSGTGHLGLFGMLFASTVRDLTVSDAQIDATDTRSGVLAGTNGGTITGCSSSGTINGRDYTGGLVGMNLGDEALVTEGYSTCVVNGSGPMGGLVGDNYYGAVTRSYCVGTATGTTSVGGLIGTNYHGTIRSCYSMAAVQGGSGAGGLVGYHSSGTIRSSFSAGPVTGTSHVGGLVGSVGHDSRFIRGFWDIETSGQTSSNGGAGLTTAEMMDPEWLALNELGGNTDWVLDAGRDYPRLVWEGTAGQPVPEPTIDWLNGSGTDDDPYQIETVEQLIRIGKASLIWEKDLALVNDLDLSGITWPQAVIPSLSGTFTGRGHVIDQLRIVGSDCLGLIGRMEGFAEVRDLGLSRVNVTGTGHFVAGMAGFSNGGIRGCYVTGQVEGRQYVGALAGCNSYASHITDSYSTASVSATSYVGGLVGYNYYGAVSKSYHAGIVAGDQYVGGLVGRNRSGSTADSFWNTELFDLSHSDGGIGLTTTAMRNINTYLNAGWDFAGETANGTADTWKMPPKPGYPVLAWPDYPRTASTEDFETGDFSLFDWQHAGDSPWRVALDQVHGGSYSARAGAISDDQTSTLKLTLDCLAGDIRFFTRVSSESFYDKLTFHIDGQRKAEWSGQVDWTEVSYTVPAGSHTFEWVYSKDGSASDYNDTAWIDDVSFPIE